MGIPFIPLKGKRRLFDCSQTGALEIHHAVDDAVVSIEYSRNLSKLLDGTQLIHTLYEYPNGGHNIEGTSFTTAMQRTVEFYKKYL